MKNVELSSPNFKYLEGKPDKTKGARVYISSTCYLDYSLSQQQLGYSHPILDNNQPYHATLPEGVHIVSPNFAPNFTSNASIKTGQLENASAVTSLEANKLNSIYLFENHPHVLSSNCFIALKLRHQLAGFHVVTPWGFSICSESDPNCPPELMTKGIKILSLLLHPLMETKIENWVNELSTQLSHLSALQVGLTLNLSPKHHAALLNSGIYSSIVNDRCIINAPAYQEPQDFKHFLATLKNLREN